MFLIEDSKSICCSFILEYFESFTPFTLCYLWSSFLSMHLSFYWKNSCFYHSPLTIIFLTFVSKKFLLTNSLAKVFNNLFFLEPPLLLIDGYASFILDFGRFSLLLTTISSAFKLFFLYKKLKWYYRCNKMSKEWWGIVISWKRDKGKKAAKIWSPTNSMADETPLLPKLSASWFVALSFLFPYVSIFICNFYFGLWLILMLEFCFYFDTVHALLSFPLVSKFLMFLALIGIFDVLFCHRQLRVQKYIVLQ